MYVTRETETVATLKKMLADMQAWKTKAQSEHLNVDIRVIDDDIESMTAQIADAQHDLE